MFMPGVFLRFYALSHLNLQRLYRRILTIGILFVCMMLTKMINKVKNFLAKGVGGSDKHFRPPLPPPQLLSSTYFRHDGIGLVFYTYYETVSVVFRFNSTIYSLLLSWNQIERPTTPFPIKPVPSWKMHRLWIYLWCFLLSGLNAAQGKLYMSNGFNQRPWNKRK